MLKKNTYKYILAGVVFLFLFFGLYQRQNAEKTTINLELIFSDPKKIKLKNNAKNILTLVSTGDVSLANEINTASIRQYKNFNWPFEKVFPVFRDTDISIINLESVLIPGCDGPGPHIYILCGHSTFIQGIKQAGINVVNIANNHIIDYGVKDAKEEIIRLKREGFVVSGVDESGMMTVKDTKIGFLGFNDIEFNDIEPTYEEGSKDIIYQAGDIGSVRTHIANMRKKSDIVIVSFHWGTEYTDTITERQKYLAHVAIDSGADLILGNHPHWIQPVEVYKNKLIVYSHGSLIFNQDNFELAKKASEQTKIGIMGKYYFADNKIVGVEFIPIKINSHNQPHFMEAKDSREILRKIEEKSYQLLK